MAFDPNLPDDVKKGLKARGSTAESRAYHSTGPLIHGLFGMTAPTDEAPVSVPVRNNSTAAARLYNSTGPLARNTFGLHAPGPASEEASPPTSAASAAASTKAPADSNVHFIPLGGDEPSPDVRPPSPAGVTPLPAGFTRYQGDVGPAQIYEGRSKDGVPIFTDNPDRAIKSLRARGATSFQGTQVDPRLQDVGMDGTYGGPGVMAFSTPAQTGIDTSFGAKAPISQRQRYAQNSLHANMPDVLLAHQQNPEAAASVIEMLKEAMSNDPAANSPEVQASNRAAMAQAQANLEAVRRRFYGGGDSLYGMAASGGKGGLGLRDILTNRYRSARLAERTASDNARLGIEQQQADRAAAAEARQARDSMLRNFQTALKTDPNAAAAIIQQNAPSPNMSRSEFDKWSNSDKGKAWTQMFQSMLDQDAIKSLGRGPMDYFDRADLRAGRVGLSRLGFDAQGNFAGLNDADGDLAYPNSAWYSPEDKYNMGVVNSVSPQYLKWLQEDAKQRLAVPRG